MSGNVVSGSTVNGEAQFLRSHRRVAHQLPPPSETWARVDAPPIVADRISKLLSNHVIEIEEHHGADTDHDAHLYRTRASAYRYVQEHLDEPTLTPCGHTGVRNLGGGEYTCQDAECDARFDRAAAREVLEG